MHRGIFYLLSVVCIIFASPAMSQEREGSVSPLLARYAREKADVYLVIVTRMETWAPQTNLSPGDEIAKLRAEEARCATRALGIHAPILLNFGDGALGEKVRPPWATLAKVESDRKLAIALRDYLDARAPTPPASSPPSALAQAIARRVQAGPVRRKR